ncbi:MAG TPA: gamma-glutamylcyclotransferase family protein [Thermoleophilaceae bacterium]|nr:gamma-glutamylcyclotransferase family protein [Thermoleophilaceae bacterium]
MGRLSEADFVFGYGSLAHDLLADVTVTRLEGHRRAFGVAADNSQAIPGYKRYRSPVDGSFPDVFVAFLDLVAHPPSVVNGVLASVDAGTRADLDRRERNYDRIEVTTAIDTPPAGRVWAYVGSPDGRARLRAGIAAGSAVVQRAYLDHVHDGFRRLGGVEHDHFLASSDLDDLPVVELERVDLPPDGTTP